MINALYSGLSSIMNHQLKLDVLGNNISNVDTIGFKGSRMNFTDALSLTISDAGSLDGTLTNPLQVGLGMGTRSIDAEFSQGALKSTGNFTDVAIQGNTFFVLNNGEQQLFSRDGSFHFNADGSLVNAMGYTVQGRMSDTGGVSQEAGSISDIVLDMNLTTPALATSQMYISGNINSTPQGGEKAKWNLNQSPFTLSSSPEEIASSGIGLSDISQFAGITNGQSIDFNITDESGTLNTIAYTYQDGDDIQSILSAINENTDAVSASYNSSTGIFSITSNSESSNTQISLANQGSGFEELSLQNLVEGSDPINPAVSALVYDSTGASHTVAIEFRKLSDNEWGWSASLDGEDSGETGTITFTNGAIDSHDFSDPLTLTLESGETMTITVSPDGKDGLSGLTNHNLSNSLFVGEQNGKQSGSLTNYSIGLDGSIIAQFTNGTTMAVAQISVAGFNNPNGLVAMGGSAFQASTSSGEAIIGDADELNTRLISGALEMSNVDLAEEFTEMIISQRGFQAATKVISTADQIMEEAVRLKR